MIESLSDNEQDLLNEYAHTFYGYGNTLSPYWFIGMEEGGGLNLTEIRHRISAWNELGKCAVADLAKFHIKAGMEGLVINPQKTQKTWKGLIDILQTIHGGERINNVQYQACHLGRQDGTSCLLELLPLPRRTMRDNIYENCRKHGHICNTPEYRKHFFKIRKKKMTQMINEYKPRLVLFYGTTYLQHWQKVAGTQFTESQTGIYLGQQRAIKDQTLFAMIKHPVSWGLNSNYCSTAGEVIAKRLQS